MADDDVALKLPGRRRRASEEGEDDFEDARECAASQAGESHAAGEREDAEEQQPSDQDGEAADEAPAGAVTGRE
jgi:hypothetical protein